MVIVGLCILFSSIEQNVSIVDVLETTIVPFVGCWIGCFTEHNLLELNVEIMYYSHFIKLVRRLSFFVLAPKNVNHVIILRNMSYFSFCFWWNCNHAVMRETRKGCTRQSSPLKGLGIIIKESIFGLSCVNSAVNDHEFSNHCGRMLFPSEWSIYSGFVLHCFQVEYY